MTRNDEFIGHLEGYLDAYEGVTPLPDSVRDAVRVELPHTKQTAPLTGLSRIQAMTMQMPAVARYGLAAAAVITAVVIGANFLNRDTTGAPSPTPIPSAGPMSLVDASPAPLAAGEYSIDLPVYPARIDFELPDGWFLVPDEPADADFHALLVVDSLGGFNSAWGLAFMTVGEVLVDPCDPAAGTLDSSVTESVDSLVAALTAYPAFPTTVEDVTVGGFPGQRLETTFPKPMCPELSQAAWFRSASYSTWNPQLPTSGPRVNQLTLLDINGSVLAIWTSDFAPTTSYEAEAGVPIDPEGHAAHQAVLHQILDSIVITPR